MYPRAEGSFALGFAAARLRTRSLHGTHK